MNYDDKFDNYFDDDEESDSKPATKKDLHKIIRRYALLGIIAWFFTWLSGK